MAKIFRFPLQKFFKNVFEEIKKRQDDLTRQKIQFLYKEAYKYFLDEYLMKIAKRGEIDFPEWFYLAGKVISQEAEINAIKAVLEVIKAGRVNYCYTKRINQIKNKRV